MKKSQSRACIALRSLSLIQIKKTEGFRYAAGLLRSPDPQALLALLDQQEVLLLWSGEVPQARPTMAVAVNAPSYPTRQEHRPTYLSTLADSPLQSEHKLPSSVLPALMAPVILLSPRLAKVLIPSVFQEKPLPDISGLTGVPCLNDRKPAHPPVSWKSNAQSLGHGASLIEARFTH